MKFIKLPKELIDENGKEIVPQSVLKGDEVFKLKNKYTFFKDSFNAIHEPFSKQSKAYEVLIEYYTEVMSPDTLKSIKKKIKELKAKKL